MRHPLPVIALLSLLAASCADESVTGHTEAIGASDPSVEAVAQTAELAEQEVEAADERVAAEPEAQPIPTHDTPPPAPCTQAWFEYEQAQMAGGGQAGVSEAAFRTRCEALPESTRPCLLSGYAHANVEGCTSLLEALPDALHASAAELFLHEEDAL